MKIITPGRLNTAVVKESKEETQTTEKSSKKKNYEFEETKEK